MAEQSLQISYSLGNIENAVDQFWQFAHKYRILAFSGEMGAGKTTFIHALCDHLKVEDVVSSPTFALINEYHFLQNGADKKIYHMDWYRLKDAEEAINAGLEDALNDNEAFCFVEWAEKATDLLPKPYVWIDIIVVGESERRMEAKVKSE